MTEKGTRKSIREVASIAAPALGAPPPESASERRARETAEYLEEMTQELEAMKVEMVEATNAAREVKERAAPLLERLEAVDVSVDGQKSL